MNFKTTKLDSKTRKIKKQLKDLAQRKNTEKTDQSGDHQSPESPPKKSFATKVKEQIPQFILLILAIIIPLFVVARAYNILNETGTIKNIFTQGLIKTVGKKLPADADGYTNFLLLGTGTETHGGKDLTDTIILASYHQEKGNAILTSIPRDFYHKHPDYWGQKINALYASAYYNTGSTTDGYQAISQAISEITGREIHKYVRLNFDTFTQIIDAVGGVTVNVESNIYDSSYPTDNYGYQIFKLDAGLQTLDGETALKYVRSRHGTSDFDRSRRQQQVLFALKEKAQSLEILTSPEKIQELFAIVETGIDTNLEVLEMIELGGKAVDFDRSKLVTLQLNDDPTQKAGLLYTPPRYLYNDTFVLRPLGNTYAPIHMLLNLHYKYPEAMQETRTISVLNGTASAGLARSAANVLTRFGFIITHLDNADTKTKQQTTMYQRNTLVQSSVPAALQSLLPHQTSQIVPAAYQTTTIENDTDFILEIGADSIQTINNLRSNQFVPVFAPEPNQEEQSQTTESTDTTNDQENPDNNPENEPTTTNNDSETTEPTDPIQPVDNRPEPATLTQ